MRCCWNYEEFDCHCAEEVIRVHCDGSLVGRCLPSAVLLCGSLRCWMLIRLAQKRDYLSVSFASGWFALSLFGLKVLHRTT